MSVRATHAHSVADSHAGTRPDLAALSERLDWQSILSAPEPERAALLRLKARWPLSPRRIRFHRNHGIESALSVLRPFLEYAGIDAEFVVSDYDDSLSFSTVDAADVEVIWLDYTRFTDRSSAGWLASWVGDRVAALRAHTAAPILVFDWDGPTAAAVEFSERLRESVEAVGGVRLADRGDLFEQLGERYFDAERVSITGTRMSGQGAIGTARLLGAKWLPALLEPRLKAVVVDLDNTLYDGVLGEDGSDALLLTEGHAKLQRELISLRDSGLFLGLLSRNHPADVRALFQTRTDFPLDWDDFSAHSIGWQPKSAGVEAIAQALRVDTGAILFVDDNVGELLETLQHLPRLRCLYAEQDAYRTVSCLRYFPGLWKFESTSEDELRIADTRANETRDRSLAVAADDVASYYRELEVRLTVGHDREEQLHRVAELSRKTNQFNLALRRYSESELASLLAAGQWQLSTARLEDRLTDSGVIAIAVSERQDSKLVVHELCISCRALGRRLEDLIVAQMLVSGPLFAETTEVTFPFLDGPRNRPARTWLSEFAGVTIPAAPQPVELSVPPRRVVEASANPHVSIEVL